MVVLPTYFNSLPETNSDFAPEHGGFQSEFPFGKVYVQVRTVSFREAKLDPKTTWPKQMLHTKIWMVHLGVVWLVVARGWANGPPCEVLKTNILST